MAGMRTSKMTLVLLVALAVCACSLTTALAQPQEIRVGLVFPLTGPLGFLGTEQWRGVVMALDKVNAEGGVHGIPIRYFTADSQSSPATGATEAQRLIDQYDVSVIIGAYSSAIANSISTVAERNEVVHWEVGAVDVGLSKRGYRYFVRTVGDATTYGVADLAFLQEVIAPALGKDARDIRIGIVHENGPFGTSVADSVERGARELGLNVVIRESYPVDATDLTALILRLKDANPEVIFITPLVADALLFWSQARDLDLNPKVIIGSAGMSAPAFLERFGVEGTNYVMTVEPPSAAGTNPQGLNPETAALLEWFVKTYQETYGHPPLIHAGLGFGSTYILATEVLPRAISQYNSADPDTIRRVASEIDIPKGGTIFGHGVKINEAGDNERGAASIMQWQDGELYVVWPRELATREPVLPMPTWSEREGQ